MSLIIYMRLIWIQVSLGKTGLLRMIYRSILMGNKDYTGYAGKKLKNEHGRGKPGKISRDKSYKKDNINSRLNKAQALLGEFCHLVDCLLREFKDKHDIDVDKFNKGDIAGMMRKWHFADAERLIKHTYKFMKDGERLVYLTEEEIDTFADFIDACEDNDMYIDEDMQSFVDRLIFIRSTTPKRIR